MVELINQLSEISGWDLVVFTMDWHPADHISFVTSAHKFKQHSESKVSYDLINVKVKWIK